MTTATDITALQTATAQAVKDMQALAKAQTDLAAAQAQVTQLTADKAALTTANADLSARLAAANTALTAAQNLLATVQPDANRWQKARMPDPTTYDKFFAAGGITSVALSALEADKAIDDAIAGKAPAGSFLGMYQIMAAP